MSFSSLNAILAKSVTLTASLAFAATASFSTALLASQPSFAVEPYEYAIPSTKATQALLLDVAKIGSRLVAVGEFGHVLHSDNDGATWEQASSVPTRNTLTAVTFLDNQTGYAVGHEATIIKTTDGGDTWKLQRVTRRGEHPLFGVYFSDANNGIAIGAFSVVFETSDGGETWTNRRLVEDSYDDFHLNGLFADRKGNVYIPAEYGTIYKSSDGAKTFDVIETPYDGSFWGGMMLSNGSLLVWGMRGNVYFSTDGGDSWEKSVTKSDRSVSGGTQLDDGTIVLAGLSGSVLVSKDNGANFKSIVRPDRKSFATVSSGPEDTVLLYGDPGVLSHNLND